MVASKKKTRNSRQVASQPVSNASGPPWILIGGALAVIGVTAFVMLSPSTIGNSAENPGSTLAENHASSEEEPELAERPAPPPPPVAAPDPIDTDPVVPELDVPELNFSRPDYFFFYIWF